MTQTRIKNIVFDIGNVVVRWDPDLIAARTFDGSGHGSDIKDAIFGDDLWLSWNRGERTEAEMKHAFAETLGLEAELLDRLFFHIKDSQDLNEDTVRLMRTLKASGFRLFALTDNVHEIVHYLKERYAFWDLFEHATVSAEVGVLKPSAEIFHHVLNTNGLHANETVFFDDVAKNVAGAKAVGIHSFVFTSVANALADLERLGVDVSLDH